MLDASLQNSFFTRDSLGNIIGMDSSPSWHSECGNNSEGGGVMMINSHYKENIDYDNLIRRYGDDIIKMEDQAHQHQTTMQTEQPKPSN